MGVRRITTAAFTLGALLALGSPARAQQMTCGGRFVENGMTTGQVLKILATDPGSVKDFQAFAKQTGNALLEHAEADKVFTFFLKRK